MRYKKLLNNLCFLALILCIWSSSVRHAEASVSVAANPLGVSNGLVGYWSFDDKYTDFVNNKASSTIQGNTDFGTMIGMTASGARVVGKINQGFNFNGSSRIEISNQTPFNFEYNQPFSLSVWTNANTPAEFFSKQLNSGTFRGYELGFTGGSKIALDLETDATHAIDVNTSVPSDSAYHHYVATYNGSGSASGVKIYVDGVQQSTTVGSDNLGGGTILNASALIIGSRQGGGDPFTGSIDEPRVYNRVLTASEVNTMYHQRLPTYISSGVLPLDVNSGLVGYYTLDGSKVNWSTNRALDSTATANSGVINNMSVTTATRAGKFNQSLFFDGSDDSITLSANSAYSFGTGNFTLSVWVKETATQGNKKFIQRNNGSTAGYQLQTNGSDKPFFFLRDNSGVTSVSVTGANAIDDTKWHHLVAERVGTSAKLYVDGVLQGTSSDGSLGSISDLDSCIIRIGAEDSSPSACSAAPSASFFSGNIDDVRIYRRALSASEITSLYKAAAPFKQNISATAGPLSSGLVGYWTMDGKNTPWTSATAGTAIDSSGNGNTGTLTSMNRATAPVIGKIGQGLLFDGVNDYIDLGTPSSLDFTSRMTVSVWVKPNSSSATKSAAMIVTNRGVANNKFQILIANGLPAFTVWQSSNSNVNVSSGTSISANVWHHLVGTANGSNISLYMDGVLVAGPSGYDGTIQSSPNNSTIGNVSNLDADRFYGGIVDDVRLYNRGLSASEVASLYKSGR